MAEFLGSIPTGSFTLEDGRALGRVSSAFATNKLWRSDDDMFVGAHLSGPQGGPTRLVVTISYYQQPNRRPTDEDRALVARAFFGDLPVYEVYHIGVLVIRVAPSVQQNAQELEKE